MICFEKSEAIVFLRLDRAKQKQTNTIIEIDDRIALRDHPFKTSAFLRGGGVKNLPNLPTDSSKKLPTVGG